MKMRTSHTHIHSVELQLFRHVGPPDFKTNWVNCSSFYNTNFPYFRPVNLEQIAGLTCHIQYLASNFGLQQISWYFICKFFNVEKSKYIKYSLFLFFMIPWSSCNTNSQFISLKRYLNTDWIFNMCFWKTVFLISRTIKFLVTPYS